MKAEAVLCYVDGGKAYFTTQKLEDQWGDDWDDAPYEHNAGIPHKPCWHREQRNCPCDICEREWDGLTPKWEIVEVVFEYSADRPSDLYNNSPYSVNDINEKKVPWLRPYDENNDKIYAGTTLTDFCKMVMRSGGKIYRELKEGESIF